MSNQEYLIDLRENINKQVRIIKEIVSFVESSKNSESEEKKMISLHIESLKTMFRRVSDEVSSILDDMAIVRPLPTRVKESTEQEVMIPIIKKIHKKPKQIIYKEQQVSPYARGFAKKIGVTELERKIIKRLKRKEKKAIVHKEKKASNFVRTANKLFEDYAKKLSGKQMFQSLQRDISRANMDFVLTSYISVMIFSIFLSIFAGIFLFLFFLFFNIGIALPIITTVKETMGNRFLETFWILLVVPLGTFLIMYFYPMLERKHIENKINQELPFATIHMSSNSASMVEPSKIFSIIISTQEYPTLEKEFTKLINEINVYGYDFVTALRNIAFNSPSARLSELFNGLATTINSGGSLPEFFDKRAQTLLFEYRLEREKYTKTAETFMDIYISLVIAAPMILMLLLIMMKVSGLGVSLSTSAITLIMVLGVSMINFIFLMFLQLKQPT